MTSANIALRCFVQRKATMDKDEIILGRLKAIEENLKFVFEIFLDIYAQKEFITYLIFLNEDKK